MRGYMWVGLVIVGACGSSETPVVELSTGEQIDLCETFLDDFCAHAPEFCDACISTACQPAAENGDIDAECAGYTDAQVEECGTSSDQTVCLEGGGCMIDALEAACEGV